MAALMAVGSAHALSFDTGDADLAVRWDNSVRYNLGLRAKKMNPEAYNTAAYDESDSKFGSRGDIVTNRLDLMSEFDVVYKRRFGARVSAAGWYDHAYNNTKVNANPVFTFPGVGNVSETYPNNEYNSYVKRWNRGSGEFLDAFVFGGMDLGTVPVDVKVGQHNVYWGESLFSFVHGVSYSQGPVDLRKAFTNPGVQAKELFMPLNQISAQTQLTDTFSVAGQYLLDWKASRIPDGGTYFGLADYFTAGGGAYVINPGMAALLGGAYGLAPGTVAPVTFDGTIREPSKKRGDWGLKATWRPAALDGTVGFYYREYTDKMPQIVAGGIQLPVYMATIASPGGPLVLPTNVGFSYLEGAKLYGMSLSKEVGGVSVGAEVVVRKNGGLLMNAATMPGTEPRGETLHALVNAIAILPHNPVFDLGSLTAEVTYSRLRKVTANAGSFNSVDYACMNPSGAASTDKLDGCATKDNWGFAMQFVPSWNQVMPGVDLSAPMVYQTGLKGNSPVLFGGYEGSGSYSLGLTADIFGKYNLALAYNGQMVKYKTTPNALNGQPSVGAVNGIGYVGDRDWLSLTFKTSF